jgi:hypothetical protein
MLNPSPVPNTNQYPAQPQLYPQSNIRQQLISATEDMRRLFEECEIGKGNAQLLNQALTFARPDELGGPVIGVRNCCSCSSVFSPTFYCRNGIASVEIPKISSWLKYHGQLPKQTDRVKSFDRYIWPRMAWKRGQFRRRKKRNFSRRCWALTKTY